MAMDGLVTFTFQKRRVRCAAGDEGFVRRMIALGDGQTVTAANGGLATPPRRPGPIAEGLGRILEALLALKVKADTLNLSRSSPRRRVNPLIESARRRQARGPVESATVTASRGGSSELSQRLLENARKRALRAAGEESADSRSRAIAKRAQAERVGGRLKPANPSLAMALADEVEAEVTRETLDATRSFVEWLVSARAELGRWRAAPPPRPNPPHTPAGFSERQRQAVLDGADPRVVSALKLDEPRSLVGIAAEQKLIESIVGKVKSR